MPVLGIPETKLAPRIPEVPQVHGTLEVTLAPETPEVTQEAKISVEIPLLDLKTPWSPEHQSTQTRRPKRKQRPKGKNIHLTNSKIST